MSSGGALYFFKWSDRRWYWNTLTGPLPLVFTEKPKSIEHERQLAAKLAFEYGMRPPLAMLAHAPAVARRR